MIFIIQKKMKKCFIKCVLNTQLNLNIIQIDHNILSSLQSIGIMVNNNGVFVLIFVIYLTRETTKVWFMCCILKMFSDSE